jgi:hypothetical protein
MHSRARAVAAVDGGISRRAAPRTDVATATSTLSRFFTRHGLKRRRKAGQVQGALVKANERTVEGPLHAIGRLVDVIAPNESANTINARG